MNNDPCLTCNLCCPGAEFCPVLRKEAEEENKARDTLAKEDPLVEKMLVEEFIKRKSRQPQKEKKILPEKFRHLLYETGISPLETGPCTIILGKKTIIVKQGGKEIRRKKCPVLMKRVHFLHFHSGIFLSLETKG